MKVEVMNAKMNYSKEEGYLGSLQLKVEGHSATYEMALQSNKGRDWGYSLFYVEGFGNEEQMLALEEEIETNDDLFDELIETAKAALEQS